MQFVLYDMKNSEKERQTKQTVLNYVKSVDIFSNKLSSKF